MAVPMDDCLAASLVMRMVVLSVDYSAVSTAVEMAGKMVAATVDWTAVM